MERKEIKITYIGGGSRGWAWALMKDLALSPNLCGEVSLYDIDYNAAVDNEIIGNKICCDHENAARWVYKAQKEIEVALDNADFVATNFFKNNLEF